MSVTEAVNVGSTALLSCPTSTWSPAGLTGPAGLAGIYDRYAGKLHDFCSGSYATAGDCVHDTYTTAAAQLRQSCKLAPGFRPSRESMSQLRWALSLKQQTSQRGAVIYMTESDDAR